MDLPRGIDAPGKPGRMGVMDDAIDDRLDVLGRSHNVSTGRMRCEEAGQRHARLSLFCWKRQFFHTGPFIQKDFQVKSFPAFPPLGGQIVIGLVVAQANGQRERPDRAIVGLTRPAGRTAPSVGYAPHEPPPSA